MELICGVFPAVYVCEWSVCVCVRACVCVLAWAGDGVCEDVYVCV